MKQPISDRFSGPSVSLKAKAKRMTRVDRASGDSLGMDVIFDETKKDQSILISFKNNDDVSRRIALFPGDLLDVAEIQSVAGVNVDAIAQVGVCYTNETTKKTVTCSCDNLAYLQRYIAKNPTRISAIQLSTDDESQLYNPINLSEFGPMRTFGTQALKPNAYLDPANPNKTMAVIDNLKHYQVDAKHVMDFVIGAGRRLEVSLVLGASFDAGEMLKEASKAVIG
jgi:hypothetical protein